jgi:hypothetical protein
VMDTDACSVASWTPALGLNLATESAQLPLSPPTFVMHKGQQPQPLQTLSLPKRLLNLPKSLLNSMPLPNVPLRSWPISRIARPSQMQHIFFWSQLTQILAMTKRWDVLGSFRLYVPSIIFHVFRKDYASSVWAVMEQFGQHGFRDELDSSNIHRLGNIMTLDHVLHAHFNRLELWLKAVDVSWDKRNGHHNDTKLCSHNPIPTASAPNTTLYYNTSPAL